ncbi:MAG: molecular chaperone DnaJ [Firmicutes bacterium]|nr:molecular chaperone DnaJ [Bacillota bacterium]
MAKNYYETLGVEKTASDDEIKSAFRRQAKKYHPDVNQNNADAANKFKEVNEAYECLSDSTKRANYDQYGSADGPNPNDFFRGARGQGQGQGGFSGFGGFEDIFNIFGSAFGGGQARNTAIHGSDIVVKLTLNFAEAAFGVSRTVTLMRTELCKDCSGTGAKGGKEYTTCTQCGGSGQVRYQQDTIFGRVVNTGVCKSCSGTGKIIKEKCAVCGGKGYKRVQASVAVNIPAGIDNDQVLTVRGEGESGIRGGPNGDLQVEISVKPHLLLKREGFDIKLDLPVPFTTAMLGGKIKIPSLDGKLELTIPENTQTGTILRLRGKGIKHLNKSSTYGDMYVNVIVELPKHLDKKGKEAFSKLQEELGAGSFEKNKKYLDTLNSL